MEYMGFILFLWIVGGASVAMFVVDRVADSRHSTLTDRGERAERGERATVRA
jgi:hypothetical protein